MKKIVLGILIGLVVLGLSGIATAGMLIPASDKAKENGRADNSPVIGGDEHWVLNPPGLEKIVFIHYKKGFAKSPLAGPKPSKCYKYLGAKWKTLQVNYFIDPTNPYVASTSLDAWLNLVPIAISAGAEEWDKHTTAELFNNSYTIISDGTWDSDTPDGRNELLFGNYPETGVIAVTVIWGYFSGAPSTRKIIEFDVLFDTDYIWGDATVDQRVMDLQNIATHEIGHGAGLADLYDTVCAEETMYGYSNYGEIKKRDLNTGDITGIQGLYGQ